MSILPNQTNINNDTYFFLLVDAKVINTSTINANTGLYDKLFVNTISTGSVLVDNISTLTANISSLNTNSISSGTGYISSFIADNITVSSLIGQTASISSIFVNNISSGSITAGSINGNSNFDASKWYLFPAEGTVTATLGPFGVPQYDLSNFRDIYCRELNTTQNVECGNTVNAVLGQFGAINCPDILMSPGDKVARLDVYGTNLLAGNNVLYVEGGTTLTGGGIIHGTTIGALRDPTGTVDLVRIDVLPAGMDLTSATFVSINAGGAGNFAVGGALSLAGGSYIEYNSDQHYFINTSAGNDFTDIFVGNIKGASNGSASLRINEGRGVELSNVKSLYLQDGQSSFIRGSPSTSVAVGGISSISISTSSVVADFIAGFKSLTGVSTLTKDIQLYSAIPDPWSSVFTYDPPLPGLTDPKSGRVSYLGDNYDCVVRNLDINPSIPIPDWNGALPYYPNNYAFVAGVGTYRCILAEPPPVASPPNGNPGAWVPFDPTNSVTNIWLLNNSITESGITGDKFSYIRVGSGYFDNLITSTINVSSITATNISSITAENITTEFLKVSFINNITADGVTENITVGSAQQLILTSGTDTNITATENITLSASNINLLATDFINASGEWNFNDNNLSNIGHLSAVSTSIGYISTGSLVADTVYNFSTLTSTINFASAKGQLIELQAPPDEGVGLIFYRTIDGVQTLDTAIGTTNPTGFNILSISTINIQANDDMAITSGKIMGLGATELVVINAPSLVVNSNASISSINTHFISTVEIYTDSIFTYNIGNPFAGAQLPITFNNPLNLGENSISNAVRIQTVVLDALNISTNFLSTGSLLVNNYTGNSISTNLISTGSLFSGAVSTLRLGVSSITTNTILSRTTGIDRLTGGVASVFNTFTNNLFPTSATAGVGFGPTTAGGGFYKDGYFRSTFTSVIQPDAVAGQLSNVVRINGSVSTQNVFVSSINLKQYPTRSTIGGPFFPSSFTLDGTTATTPQLLISSINFFAGAGNYDISQRMAFIKLTGGTSVDAHGSILVASTNTLLIPDSNTGYGQVPQVNDVGHSTFTTLYTSITVGTNSFQRQYKYLDTTGGNYTGSLYLERPVITYIPSQGLNPE